MTELIRHNLIISLFFLLLTVVASQEFNGEFSGLTNVINYGVSSQTSTYGVRYIPTLYMVFLKTENKLLDLEISGNFFGTHSIYSAASTLNTIDLKPYRLWLRFSTDRFESRLGLQKINFGPAKLLRPLMWFDRLDPRDPLQLTDGVYSLRLRYDFQNNANVWLWVLYGNNDTKGWENVPTEKNSLEGGGRFQFPMGNGELALTLHRRIMEPDLVRSSIIPTHEVNFENRIAVDGIWDIGIGLWFETALINADHKQLYPDWQSYLTLGTDYTFGIGNGLTVLGEHLFLTTGNTPFDTETRTDITGLMLLYPWGLIDQLSAFYFYNWDTELMYRYLSWQRTYDQWTFHISGFWSSGERFGGVNRSLVFTGSKGIQLIIIFNH